MSTATNLHTDDNDLLAALANELEDDTPEELELEAETKSEADLELEALLDDPALDADAELDALAEAPESVQEEPEEEVAAPVVKKTKTPRVASGKVSDNLRAKLGDKVYEVAVLTQKQADMSENERRASIDQWMEDIADNAPVHVQKKIINAIMTLNGNAKLSCYTQAALEMLHKNDGELSIADLRADYLKRPYTVGTSNSQSGQINKLLPILGITTLVGKKHIANEDSLLLELLK